MIQNNVHTYEKVNKDISVEMFPSNMLSRLLNGRLTTDEHSTDGGVANIKGNKISFTLPEGIYILGHASLDNKVYLITTDTISPDGGPGFVYELTVNRKDYTSSLECVYSNKDLNLSIYNMVQAHVIRENSNTVRLYFSDHNSETRSFNILKIDKEAPIEFTQLFPDSCFKTPLISNVLEGGNLPRGVYEYAFYLTTFDGKRSLISCNSDQLSLIGSPFNNAIDYDDSLIVSTEVDTLGDVLNSNKSVKVTADASEYPEGFYTTITFLAIYRQSKEAVPVVSEIATVALNQGTASTIHTGGETVVNIDYADYLDNSYPFITNKTFASKDGLLLPGNTKSAILDIDYDATTFRYSSGGFTYNDNYKNPFNDESGKIFGDNPQGTRDIWSADQQYRYQDLATNSGNLYIGGSGTNIDYKFILREIDGGRPGPGLSNEQYVDDLIELGDGYTQINDYLNTYDSPYIRNLRGYKRGEIYRFAIGFYDKKGNQSFLKYIGDIKMPELSETAGYVTIPGTDIDYFPICLGSSSAVADVNSNLGQDVVVSPDTTYEFGWVPDEEFSGDLIWNYTAEAITDLPTPGTLTVQIFINGDLINSTGLIINGTETGQLILAENVTVDNTDTILITFENVPFPSIPVAFSAGSGLGIFYGGANRPKFYSLGVEFNIKTLPEDICSYKIFRVPREDRFKTRLSQGYAAKCYQYNSGDGDGLRAPLGHPNSIAQYYEDGASEDGTQGQFSDRGMLALTSPEVSYDTLNLTAFGNSFLKAQGAWTSFTHKNNAGSAAEILSDDSFFERDRNIGGEPWAESQGKASETLPFTNYDTLKADLYEPIETSARLSNIYGIQNVGTEQVQNWLWNFDLQGPDDNSFSNFQARSGVKQFISLLSGDLSTNFANNEFTGDFNKDRSLFLYDYIRLLPEHYGGNDEDSVSKNVFLPVTRNIYSTGNVQTFNGDIFIEWFDSMYGFQDTTSLGGTYYINCLIPVETDINISIAHGKTRNTGALNTVNDVQGTYLIQETGNDTGDYYLYDTTYSTGLMSRPGFTKPLNFEGVTDNPTRVYISDVKIFGESVDSWSVYRSNNFRDLDPNYGELTRLSEFRDEVYGVQTTGFGMFSINPRAVTTTSDGQQTELGSAEGIQDYNYISTDSGTIHQNSVITTENAIYFYDSLQNRIICYSPGSKYSSLAEENGFQSKLLTITEQNANLLTSDLPYVSGAVIATYEPTHREVFFTFHGLTCPNTPIIPNSQIKGDAFTLVWSEKKQSFNDEYSHTPRYYVDDKKHILSPDPTDPASVYIHDKGNYGEFYGVTFSTEISFIMNGTQKLINKVMAYGEYNSVVKSNGTILQNQGLDSVMVSNDYQSTGELSLSELPNNAEHVRRFRKWRFHIPTDATSEDYMRGPWHEITLIKDNSSNQSLLLQSFIEYYSQHEY